MTMTRYRLSRRATLGLAGAAAASVLVKLPGRSASAQVLDKVSYLTSWRAQAEHGGFYQAVAAGIYKKYGIECDLRQGGPQVGGSQLLMGGRVDMIMSSGLEALNYAKEDLPFLCIGATPSTWRRSWPTRTWCSRVSSRRSPMPCARPAPIRCRC
jgi:NitT/TauT family transport system substrate-binding protein